MADENDDTAKKTHDASARRPFNPDGGEDESSASQEGDDAGTHDDQRPITGQSSADGDPGKADKST